MTTLHRTHLTFQSDAEFNAYVAYERERRARSANRPMGARLSTPCPVRMCQAVYDDSAQSPIDPGDAERGHEIESRVRATLLYDVKHAHQPRVDWSHGVTANDMLMHEPVPDLLDADDLVEVKSTIGSMGVHPDHRATTTRRMVAANMPVGSVVKLLVVHPGNYRWAGPFDIVLDQDAQDRWSLQLSKIASTLNLLATIDAPERQDWWRLRTWWNQRGLACDCGGCTDHIEVEPNDALVRLAYRYAIELDAADEAAAALGGKVSVKWSDNGTGVRASLLDALDRQAGPRKQEAIRTGEAIRIKTDALGCSWSPKAGRWTLKRPAKPKTMAAAA